MVKLIAISGGFDPIHKGHVRLITEAERLGDRLVLILNSDKFLDEKKENVGGRFYPDISERKEIMEWGLGVRFGRKAVVVESIDSDMSVCKTLEMIRDMFPNDKMVFANGGDRDSEKEIREAETCFRLGIQMVFNVGGGKIQSSSDLIHKAKVMQ